MIGGESFAGQFRDPVTELVVKRRDKAAPLTIEVMTDTEGEFTAVEVVR